MAEQKPNNKELRDTELDRLLDSALAKYAAAEPRAGLESRILANLRAARSRVPERSWWRWGLAAVAAVFVIALALAFRPGKSSKPTIASHPDVTVQPAPEQEHKFVSQDHGAVRDAPKPVRKRPRRRYSSEIQLAARVPKLDQFPSPQPLSEQELALARYVRDFPQEAVLVAQSQQESEVEMQKKMGITEPMSSEQQER